MPSDGGGSGLRADARLIQVVFQLTKRLYTHLSSSTTNFPTPCFISLIPRLIYSPTHLLIIYRDHIDARTIYGCTGYVPHLTRARRSGVVPARTSPFQTRSEIHAVFCQQRKAKERISSSYLQASMSAPRLTGKLMHIMRPPTHRNVLLTDCRLLPEVVTEIFVYLTSMVCDTARDLLSNYTRLSRLVRDSPRISSALDNDQDGSVCVLGAIKTDGTDRGRKSEGSQQGDRTWRA